MFRTSLRSKILPVAFASGILLGVVATTMATAAFKGSAVFVDVPAGHFADDAIGEMVSLGIIKGMDATHFDPNAPLTRGQAAILMQRLRNELKGIVAVSSSSVSSASSSSSSVAQSSSSSSSSSVASSSSSSSTGPLTYNPGGYVHFASREYNVDKNVATGNIIVVIARTGGNTGAGTVDYAFNTGTAVVDKDYKPQTGTLTFASKETSKKITIQIVNNTADTANVEINLKLSKPTGALKIDNPDGVVKINDPRLASSSSSSAAGGTTVTVTPSAATIVSFSASAYALGENDGSVTVTVLRTGVTTGTTTVGYSTGDGTAHSGSDYSSTSGTLSFAAGETSKTFSVSVGDNTIVDGNRSFSVNLNNPSTGVGLDTASATIEINDNESITTGSGSFKFASSSYNAYLSDGKAKITIRHVGGVKAASVTFSTTGGSAIPGTDYTSTVTTVNFAVGETSKIVTVPLGNNTSAAGRVVNIALSSPTGATTSDPSIASFTISQ